MPMPLSRLRMRYIYTHHTHTGIVSWLERALPFPPQDPSQSTVRALLGSTSDEDTIALSRVSQADKMPIMGYKVETADLSDKVRPYFTNTH